MKRKLFAVLLVLALALSVMPLAASATEADPCENGHTWGTDYTYNTDYHTRQCTVCGEYEIKSHTLVNNVCTVCGIVQGGAIDSSHCNHFLSVVEQNGTQHHFRCDCGQGDFWENHKDANGDGVCDGCSYGSENCTHAAAIWITRNQFGHRQYCPGCDKEIVSWTEHNANGCDICGFKPCTNGHTFGTGNLAHECKDCGFITQCEDANGDCICDICGDDYVYGNDIRYDETYHWLHCEKCGKDVWKETHFDNDNDGICEGCGYNKSTGTVEPNPDIPNPNTPAPPSGGSSDPRLDNVPKTGDISVCFLAAALTLFGAAALTVKKYVF